MRNLILVLAFIATPAFASGYSVKDAASFTGSKDPAVLNYVVCLANAYDSMSTKVAHVACRGFAAKIKDGNPADVEGSVSRIFDECGYLPDDMGCE